MKHISIKTVDGGRYEYTRDDVAKPFDDEGDEWFEIKSGAVRRRFYTKNIVSITIKNIEEE